MENVVDLHLRPYYGDEDETDGLYYNEAKDGTTAFHAYATLLTQADASESLGGILWRASSLGSPAKSTLA